MLAELNLLFVLPNRFRKAGYAAVDSICDYYTNLRDLPVVAQVEPGYLVNDLPSRSAILL